MLTSNKAVYGTDGSLKTLKDMGDGDISQLTERVASLENTVNDIDDDIYDMSIDITSIKNYINNPGYSEQILCYADGASARTKTVNPGRIAYVYEIDKSLSQRKVLSSFSVFVKPGYIGTNDVIISLTKGTIYASLYGNPDGKFVFQISNSEEPENTNIIYVCGTIENIN